LSTDRFAEVERLYHEAALRRPEERAAFLDQACSGDDALRGEVESLLSLPTDAGEFLSRTALEEAARTGHRPWEPHSWPTIPGYAVRRVLGEGGMGVVYLAEQETPFRRLVALKLIKPGMDTRQVVARFETERQALALMDHPNIAAVFDAGSTKERRPYFVMEYVDGVSITDYCDSQRLSTSDRLALFVQVCAAVQHAHQKGVIHRDLKPSNVLVTERDGQPLPKVIDFGTAKAVGGAWNATATQGGQGMVLGTLEYMSPEQAALSADIDTATDVYSLGVLLYELLVGRLPFDTDELRTAGYDEIRRVIRESDPPKPSVRVEQRRDRARQTDAPGLTRQLRGDLDWITLKALEKDRKRRYATVAAFATDIGRFLDDQPVEARPPSSTYRIRKFTRRHRLAVAAVAAIITILAAAVTATTGLYWQAEGARREATYLAYAASLAAAAGDLRMGAAAEARARLLTVPEAQRGWEWRHLFVQTDESTFTFSSDTRCESEEPIILKLTAAHSLDADGDSLFLRRCGTRESWNLTTFARTAFTAPTEAISILATNSRGQVLILRQLGQTPRYQLELTDRISSAAAVEFGPFATMPMCADISPDGARIAFAFRPEPAAATTAAPGDLFEIWNAATGRFEFRLGAAAAPSGTRGMLTCKVRFSSDGRRLATSGATVRVWDAFSGDELASDSLQAGFYRQPIAFSRDGARLAIGRATGLLDVLNLSQSPPTLVHLSASDRVVEGWIPDSDRIAHRREVFAVAFSPDDQTVVTANSATTWCLGYQAIETNPRTGRSCDRRDGRGGVP
jgi:serine/threonine protein kinase